MEENNWQVSNKKSGNKRFLRQLIIFIISILIIGIAIIIFVIMNKNKVEKEEEKVGNSENNTEVENIEPEEEKELSKISLDSKVYSIENKDFYFENEEENEYSGIKIYEYDNTKSEYAEIYYKCNSYYTDPSYKYIIEAKSETGESLLLNDRENPVSEREVIGGIVSSIKINKEKVGTKIDITVKEVLEHSSRSRTLERQGKVTIELDKDLQEQEKVDFKSSTASYELEDIKFETYKEDKTSKDTYTMASPNCKKQYYSIGISTQYGNRIVLEEYIEFSALNNINNLELDEAFDIEKQITEKIGQYGLLDQYKVFASNGSGEITNEYDITFEDMKELIAGKDVSANGKRLSARDILSETDNAKIISNSKVTLSNGRITAIKYSYSGEQNRTNYMFILNGNIYYIVVPNGEKYEENVNLFLNSLTIK